MKAGRDLRSVRRRRGLTLDELSELCGVSRDDLGLYERGRMTPRPGTVEKIAQALDVPLESIQEGMGWTGQAAERWEAPSEDPLREGVLEAVRDACGEELALKEEDVRALMEAVKVSIPALVEHLKDTRPQGEIHRELLAQLDEADGGEEPFALTDGQWEQIRDLLPPEKAGRGRAFKSNRLMLEGILHRIKSGQPWSRLPERYGRHKCVSDRLRLWQSTGVWDRVLARLADLGILDGTEGT